MSSIYGTTRRYSPEVLERKRSQMQYRCGEAVKIDRDGIEAVLDGNIYNRRELMDIYSPDTVKSDAELLGRLYAKLGKDCLKLLNGDFAFVVHDKENGRYFGAVDRVGDKPLFYHHGTEGFEYCSQLLPLCIGNQYEIDGYARQCYFSMQYIPAPFCIVKQVRKLGAGECFAYDEKSGKLTVETYWDLYSNTCGFDEPSSYKEALDRCRSLIDDAVALRMTPEETQGVFLSGGIDSSTVAKFAVKNGGRLEGFSVAFEESDFDESEYARKVAERYGIPFNRLLCTAKEAIAVIHGLQQYYDEPVGDYSSIPTSLVCEKTGLKVSAALGGDGGDEMFFGYPRYLRYAGREKTYSIPRPIRSVAAMAVRAAGKKRLADSLLLKNVQQLYLNRRPSNKAELFNAFEVQQSIPQTKYLYGNKDLRKAFNDFDIKTLMCYGYNVKLDCAAARGHLDVRTPLLDYRIVEYSRLLPVAYCYNKDTGQKRILRDLLYEDFDRSMFERHKRGFGVPLGAWFRAGLKDYLCDVLNQQALDVLPDYNSEALLRVRDRHISGEDDQTTLLWLCVNYLEWYRLFQNCSN